MPDFFFKEKDSYFLSNQKKDHNFPQYQDLRIIDSNKKNQGLNNLSNCEHEVTYKNKKKASEISIGRQYLETIYDNQNITQNSTISSKDY